MAARKAFHAATAPPSTDSEGITDADCARLLKILFEHQDAGGRSSPDVHLEYEALMRKLHSLEYQPFAVAIGQLARVLHHYGRMVADWSERPFTETLAFIDLAGTRRG